MLSLLRLVFALGAIQAFVGTVVWSYEGVDDGSDGIDFVTTSLHPTSPTSQPPDYAAAGQDATTDNESSMIEEAETPETPSERPQTRQCGGSVKNLWLDIVFVLDSSMGVNRHDFNFQKAMIIGLIDEITVNQEAGQYSRIAFVNTGRKAHRISNLTSYQSNQEARDDLMKNVQFIGDHRINVGAGLIEAQKVLDDSDERPNVRNLVVLFSSKSVNCRKKSFGRLLDEHPCRIAATIQERGAVLLTVAMNFHETADSPPLQLGSPCFATRNDLQFRDNFHAMALKANCFCHAPYTQLADEGKCESFGECIYLAESPTVYPAANLGCQMDGAVLVDVFDKTKSDFLQKMAIDNEQAPFWIGLNGKPDGEVVWESGSDFSLGDFNQFQNSTEPRGQFCTSVHEIGADFQWQPQECSYGGPTNYYFCQREACDADNYCA